MDHLKQKQPTILIVGCLFIFILGFALGMEMDTGLWLMPCAV